MMIRTVDCSLQRSGAIVGALLIFLFAAWHVIGAQPGDSQQARSSSQPPPEQESEADRLAAEQAAQLEALGYLQGSVRATVAGGVSKYDPKKSFKGLNFYLSGHSPSAILMDMEGNLLHVWHYPFENAWKDYPGKLNVDHKSFWRRAHLYENGDLLAIFEGLGMIKLDRNSRLLWTSGFKQHHDLDVHENGDIYVLTRMGAMIPSINKRKPVIEDSITILGPDGWLKRSFSLIEALERYPDYALYWNRYSMVRPPTRIRRFQKETCLSRCVSSMLSSSWTRKQRRSYGVFPPISKNHTTLRCYQTETYCFSTIWAARPSAGAAECWSTAYRAWTSLGPMKAHPGTAFSARAAAWPSVCPIRIL